MTDPMISIVIPCRNEENFIGMCLESIISNDYPKDHLEVLVVDGVSEDRTRDIVKTYVEKCSYIKLLNNPKKITPCAMNIGIKEALGSYIIILGSHSKIKNNFIKLNVRSIEENKADCVGGVTITLPSNETVIAQSIALALSHPFGVGNAYFRVGSNKPRYVDTVPFGCYKKELFSKIGYFDEDLARNQDDEFNLRLIKNGGKILLAPDIVSYYHARDSISKIWQMFFQYGYFKPLVAKKVGGILTWRQMMPALFVGSLLISLLLSFIFKPFFYLFLLISSLYCLVNLGISFHIAMKKGWKHFLMLPIVFATVHFSYGIGYLKGIWDFLVLKKNRRKKIEDVPLTR